MTTKNLPREHNLAIGENGCFDINVMAPEPAAEAVIDATTEEVNNAICRADDAFFGYSTLPAEKRAEFLRTIAEQILYLGDELIDMVHAETGLARARIEGERGRTMNQLRMFAYNISEQEFQGIIEPADEQRQPMPKPDTRLGYLPLGAVAVFGASNFPLAFSTAGGDTASALAAGCPVVMKAHSAHPGTSALVASAIANAIEICSLDPGVFSLIKGKNHQITSQIVTHPLIKAVGFTGSERVGMIIQKQINERAEPIPFYGELGSVNPQFILPGKVKQSPSAIAKDLVDSLMIGQGQFCTSPGLWVISEDEHYEEFCEAVRSHLEQQAAGVMLTAGIGKSYQSSVEQRQNIAGVDLLAIGQSGAINECRAAVFSTDLSNFSNETTLQEEVFGSSALIVRCQDIEQMLMLVEVLKGNLTAGIHAEDADIDNSQRLANALVHKVGRLIYNQMPTGVEVCASMNHGGPFPAATNVQSTSVGSKAIERFRRPICYQNMPQQLLPELLRD
ncbi:aldehyde dehydrogenase (NADP(+)) [Thalassotalea sp. ND16A]|uniref:aldehyde dehydrogenase (NADP(+)) n=1 Tax=Thalassotalea sp. ND16A TaxID=1535422 RepID=UPI00051A4781|nr:aldehyde dehydrogenase (NADP(+)) [Thalassotalea sp. ND16A]KGJ98694.1 Aldehyde dehydrogenase (NADP(+)) [Thalassotalea sp. ND16A]